MVGRGSGTCISRDRWRKELGERETSCGWTSLNTLSYVDLGDYPLAITRVYLWPGLRGGTRV